MGARALGKATLVATAVVCLVYFAWRLVSCSATEVPIIDESSNTSTSQAEAVDEVKTEDLVSVGLCPLQFDGIAIHQRFRPCSTTVMRDAISAVLHGKRELHGVISHCECGPDIPFFIVDKFMAEWPFRFPDVNVETMLSHQHKSLSVTFPRDLARHKPIVTTGELKRFLENEWRLDENKAIIQFGWPFCLDDGRVLLPQCIWVQPGGGSCIFWEFANGDNGLDPLTSHQCDGGRGVDWSPAPE